MIDGQRYDTIVIGGGAAGIIAAGRAAECGSKVLLIEKMEKPARKVRITGKGRCNITNDCSESEFLSKVVNGADFFSHSLKLLPPQALIRLLQNEGLSTITERGNRVFPSSGKAGDVANALEKYAVRRGVEIENNVKCLRILSTKNRVTSIEVLYCGKKMLIRTAKVILATGGKSYPSTGSTGDGYNLVHEHGHTIVNTRPALTPLLLNSKYLRSLNKLLLKNIALSLIVNGDCVDNQFGELEFFDYGVGGAATLKMSKLAVDALISKKSVILQLDLKPALTVNKIIGRMGRELELMPSLNIKGFYRKLMPAVLLPFILDKIRSLDPSTPIANLTEAQKTKIAETVKNINLEITGYGDFTKAIITAGGVELSEVNPETMESYLLGGLYFAGELLDLDAVTGGYNLQIAFSTGYCAGSAK